MTTSREHLTCLQSTALRAAIALAGAAGTLVSAAATMTQDGTIAVHARHYAVGGRAYTDLDQLEATVKAMRPASVRIVACEPAATRAWLAAVQRFDSLPLQLEGVDASAPACGPASMPVGTSAAVSPTGIDDKVVNRYWEQRMP
jgi:hypothetical protein